MPILGVERDGEHASRAPFKAPPGAVRKLDLRAAMPLQHIINRFEQMLLGNGRTSRRQLENEHICKIPATFEMRCGGLHTKARPEAEIDLEQIQAPTFVNGDTFLLDPFEVRIDSIARRRVGKLVSV